MRELIVLAFDTEYGALEVRDKLLELQKQELITMDDAAVVVRNEEGKDGRETGTESRRRLRTRRGVLGLLIGLIFFAPVYGMTIGAVAGALGGEFSDIGIDDEFIKEGGETIGPGESAQFLLVTDAEPDRVLEELSEYSIELLQTNLSPQDEEKLRDHFAADHVVA